MTVRSCPSHAGSEGAASVWAGRPSMRAVHIGDLVRRWSREYGAMEAPQGTRIQQASDALRRHAWQEAFEEFMAADAGGPLDRDALEGLATAAFWAGNVDQCLSAWERAHEAHLQLGDYRRAAAAALKIATRHAQRANPTLARGWRATAARLLEDQPDCPERGRLLTQEAYSLIVAGELEQARHRAAAAFAVATRCGARDVQVVALNIEGQALVRGGEVERGLGLVDESVAQARAAQLDPYDLGLIQCWTIGLCRDLADFERARDLTEATAAWSETAGFSAFPGICRIHRAELRRLHGDLAGAEAEVRSAIAELLPRTLFWAARAYNELGLIKLRQGALDQADTAFDRAQELGMEPQPGRALVQLARGRVEAANVALQRALERRPTDLLDRAALLAAFGEAAVAGSNFEAAERAVEELDAIAGTVGRAAFQAAAAEARGALLLARGEPSRAVPWIRGAAQLWSGIDAVYETARSRLKLAAALRAEGDFKAAALELDIAARAFEQMGAKRELDRAKATLRDQPTEDPVHALTRRQKEVARLISEGRSNREIAEMLFLSERTAEYHVQQILNRLGFDSRAQIAAWYARAR